MNPKSKILPTVDRVKTEFINIATFHILKQMFQLLINIPRKKIEDVRVFKISLTISRKFDTSAQNKVLLPSSTC